MRFFSQKWALVCLTVVVALILILSASGPVYAQDKTATAAATAQVTKTVGVIKTIRPDSITITAETGGEITATLTSTTRILRVPPGEKDLKNATPLQPQDLQPGDRVLVRGPSSPSADAHTITALAVIVMTHADVTAKQQHDLEDWQKRGVDGVVTKVDPASGVITVSPGRIGVNKTIDVHVAQDTVLRRYAPGSVKFDDAKPAPLDQIKVGDQLRARGTRSPDGREVTAEEIVSGSFPNVAGTIKAIDAANNTITVQDTISKSTVVVKLSPDSQLQKIPVEMAQRIALRLKAGAAGGNGDQATPNGQGQAQGQRQGQGQAIGAGRGASSGADAVRPGAATATTDAPGAHRQAGAGASGSPDLQRMLSRLPPIKLADLQKGDAVVILATPGANPDSVTAIKLLAGVEPILTAAPSRSASTLLSPWSLGGGGGEGDAAQ
ncbi:MAG: DUF5666 domain-containing protein [Terriglobales bacterium]